MGRCFLGMVSAMFCRGSYFGVWPGLYAEQAAVKASTTGPASTIGSRPSDMAFAVTGTSGA